MDYQQIPEHTSMRFSEGARRIIAAILDKHPYLEGKISGAVNLALYDWQAQQDSQRGPGRQRGKEVNEMEARCPNCGSKDVQLSRPPSSSGTDTADIIKCNNCGYPDFDEDE